MEEEEYEKIKLQLKKKGLSRWMIISNNIEEVERVLEDIDRLGWELTEVACYRESRTTPKHIFGTYKNNSSGLDKYSYGNFQEIPFDLELYLKENRNDIEINIALDKINSTTDSRKAYDLIVSLIRDNLVTAYVEDYIVIRVKECERKIASYLMGPNNKNKGLVLSAMADESVRIQSTYLKGVVWVLAEAEDRDIRFSAHAAASECV